jgi:hypothetical protein
MGHCRWQPFKPSSLVGPLRRKKNGPQDLKKQRDSPSRRTLQEILQQGSGSSSTQLRGLVANSEPAVEISVKGRDKPVARNLPEVKPRNPLLEVRSNDTPLPGVSTSSIPTAGEGLGHLVYGVGGWTLSGEDGFVWMH